MTDQNTTENRIATLENDWANNPRWAGTTRDYSAAEVVKLQAESKRSIHWPNAVRKSCGSS